MASSPIQVQPSTPNQVRSYSQSLVTDVCFHCRNQGHWAQDCPFKTPPQRTLNPKSSSSSSSSSPSSSSVEPTSNFAPFPCPNGHGSCLIRTSRTPANPGRSFYTCSFASSPNGKCGFFKWCDQVKESELPSNNVKRDRTEDYPDCRCRAGKCKVVKEKGIEYYVCPIAKGHGACNFRKSTDGADDAATILNSDENDGNRASHGSPKRTKLVDNPGPASSTLGAGGDECDDILDLSAIDELALRERERELGGFVMGKELQVSCSPLSGVVHHRQTEFLRQIYADGEDDAIAITTVKEDVRQRFLGTLISGWLGRLVYPPPSGCLTLPQPKPFFCCVFPSFDPIHVPKFRNEYYYNVQCDTPREISSQDRHSGVLSELSSIQNVPGIRRGRDFTRQISESLIEAGLHVQNQLLAILECTEPSNHKSMEEAANRTFTVLDLLSINRGSFSKRVSEFIGCARSLAGIEESMKGNQSSEEVTERYDNERANFNNISRVRFETERAVMASDQRLKFLVEDASALKAMLVQVQSQLRECEVRNAELKTRARKVSEDMLESEKKLLEAEAAKKMHEEREAEHSAAKEALESAKARLRRSVVTI